MPTTLDINNAATGLGQLVARKNAEYGNASEATTSILLTLYPEGIKPCDYWKAMLIVRICDKLCRLTRGCGSGEDPFLDIAGYGLLGSLASEEIHEDITL